jgi:hypothetical protein
MPISKKRTIRLQKLAEELHDTFCGADLDGRCSWFWEHDDWTMPAHIVWVFYAKKTLKMIKKLDEKFPE